MFSFSIKKIVQGQAFRVLLAFALLAFVIMLLAPRNRSFQYAFSEGKPWSYDLITAPYDFPIYKSAEQLRMEQDSIRQETLPVISSVQLRAPASQAQPAARRLRAELQQDAAT